MKVVVNKTGRAGIRLREAALGSVVTRSISADSPYYLVTSAMDGSGRHILVELARGVTMSSFPQDTPVTPVEAHVVVGEAGHANR